MLEADPMTQDRYAFLAGNPVNRIEFDGHYTGNEGGAQRAMKGSSTPRGERKVTRREAWVPGRSDQSNVQMNESQGWEETGVSFSGSGSKAVFRHVEQVKYSAPPKPARAAARPPEDSGAVEDALGWINEQTFGFTANAGACLQPGSSTPCLEIDEEKALRTVERASYLVGGAGLLRLGGRGVIACFKGCRTIFGSSADDAGNASDDILFGQEGVRRFFTTAEEGSDFVFAGRRVADVASGLRKGSISPDDIPVQYIVRDGRRIAINNRSLLAFRRAGVSPTQTVDVTGNPVMEARLSKRLAEMGGAPSSTIRVRGASKESSYLDLLP
jgi:hypothetical protein